MKIIIGSDHAGYEYKSDLISLLEKKNCAKNHNIAVYNTPLGPTQSVAEITVGALLSLLRKIPEANNDLHKKKWNT